MKVSKAQLVRRFKAVLLHAVDMDPAMVLEFCEECQHELDAIQFAAVQDLNSQEVSDAKVE